MNKFLFFVLCFFSFACFATTSNNASCQGGVCPQAKQTNDPGFCPTFVTAAQCHCVAHGLPAGMCNNLDKIYERMKAIYGSEEAACRAQKDTTYQTCLDDWHCYRIGGVDSLGRLCSSTGRACR